MPLTSLCELADGQEGDFFALLTAKEELTTKNGKPYFKVGFRDARREVSFPIWQDSPWAAECRDSWSPGVFYKLRAVYRETGYGPQLEIRKIREVTESDAADGFDPAMCRPQSRFAPPEMFDQVLAIAREQIEDTSVRNLVVSILTGNHDALLSCPAARHHHHAFAGGLLEHTLSVARTCAYLAEKYAEYYPQMQPPLDKDLVVAGAILHDIGKLRELKQQPEATTYTPEGALIGHLLMGRDMIREAAAEAGLDAEKRLRLEHLAIAHQRLPEWGSPKPPMTPEALIVHYADDLDAKYNMLFTILRDDTTPGPLTSKRNVLMQQLFRGLEE
jgi:3'-5' exoribonuclease